MIEVKGLCKTFKIPAKKKNSPGVTDPREKGREFHALREVSFSTREGSIVGLLGPNGAGKTTLLRILSTALKPTTGTVMINDVDITNDPLEIRRKIGFLSGNTGLYGRLTAREIVAYYGKLHRIPKDQLEARMDELFKRLDMETFTHKRADTLSAGMKQKVSIARTLVHNPEVIVFDEPTTGLDVAAAQTILEFINHCKEEGKSVIFSTHHMHEVEQLCDDVILIHEGQKCFDGSVAEMKTQTGRAHLDEAFLDLIGKGVIRAVA